MGHQHVLQFTKADQLSSLLNVQPANYKGQSESLIYHHISRRQNDHSEPGCQVDYIRFPSHSQSCFLFLPLTSKYPFHRVAQSAASHREITKVVSSGPLPRLRGGNVYILVSDDYATKWLENCPSGRQQLRFQQVNNSLEVHISEGTVMHLPLNLGVWGKE